MVATLWGAVPAKLSKGYQGVKVTVLAVALPVLLVELKMVPLSLAVSVDLV